MRGLWALFGLCLYLCGAPAGAVETDFRFKGFLAGTALPGHDVQRAAQGTPAFDSAFDLRSMLRHQVGSLQFTLDHTLVHLAGDGIEFVQGPDQAVDQTVVSDDARLFDLTWRLDRGDGHLALHRLDRLALQWRRGGWNVTAGRQAVSWGSGLVFQPLDLFSPFSPTVVDRDYKAGDDLLLVDRLLPGGHDLQLLHVVRRDADEHVTSDVSSSAVKWHGYAGLVEFEAVLGRHFQQRVAGLTLRVPAGQAMVRTDVVGVRTRKRSGGHEWRVSGIVNADYSFMLGQRNAYLFAELFYNDWGVAELPDSVTSLPVALQARVARGELFNLMRRYIAVGGNFEFHPLVSASALVIGNLDDGSRLAQLSVAYNPSDHQSLQVGWIEPLGSAGEEFGGVPVAGRTLTAGGGSRGYLRWVYYF